MKIFSLLTALIAGLTISSVADAGDRYQNNRLHSSHNRGHYHDGGNRHRHHHNKRSRNYSDNRSRNGYYGFNSPYRKNYQRDYDYYDNRRYKRSYKNHRRNYGYYNNYRPYRSDRYRYRPTRGLGHYFYRDNYGYGHWHDSMWCDIYHPQSFYIDYYSNYPYDGGWIIGDGDFGINFYLNL